MKTILKHLIAIALLLLIPVVALCCEKESPLNVSCFMNEDLIGEAKVQEEWEPARIEYESAGSYKNNDSENRGKTGKQDYWYVVNNPVGFNLLLLVIAVISGSFLIISGIMTYKIIMESRLQILKKDSKLI